MHEPTKSFSESNRCLYLEKSRSRKVNLMVYLPCSWVPTQESQFVRDKSITSNQSISPTSPLLASGIRLSSLMTQFLWCRNLVGCLPMLTCRALHQQFLQSNCPAIYDTLAISRPCPSLELDKPSRCHIPRLTQLGCFPREITPLPSLDFSGQGAVSIFNSPSYYESRRRCYVTEAIWQLWIAFYICL